MRKFITGTLDEAKDAARQFIAILYDPSRSHKEHHSSLNKLRTQLSITTNDPLSKLPPCEPVFEQHVKRVVRQTKEWVHARNPDIDIGTPETQGWEITNQGLMPVLFVGQTASEMIDGLFCECELKGTVSGQCPCILNGLTYINLCICGGDIEKCHNEQTLFATVSADE